MVSIDDVNVLQSIVGDENVSVRGADLEAHSIDESVAMPHLPEVVVWPSTAEEISAILKYANGKNIPVSPWSGGSSLEGNPIPVKGGIVLALYRLNQIIEVIEDDLQVVVQPGMIYDDLNKQLKRLGMFFPPAPGSSDVATIGGMVANNSSGMRAVKYGVTRDYVQKLKVVLADGRIIDVGSRAKKTTAGYDLVGLFVGSEGTLGIVTEVTLRLMGLPEQVASCVAVFDDLAGATNTVYEAMRYGLGPSAIELLDTGTVRVTNQQMGLDLAETPTLFIEFDGNEAGVEEQVQYLQELCEDNNCVEFKMATDADERDVLWTARREARDSIKISHPGYAMISGDICVPISKFGELVEFVRQVTEETGLGIFSFGHAGDGNLHTEIVVHRENKEEFALAMNASDRIVDYALGLDGTVAGEHGVGMLKSKFMVKEHATSLPVMATIKASLDPNGILNPGKIFPEM